MFIVTLRPKPVDSVCATGFLNAQKYSSITCIVTVNHPEEDAYPFHLP